jgi:hypothetical protein
LAPARIPAIERKNWYELREKDDLAAMPEEQILTKFDPAFGDPQITAVAEQKPIAVFTTNDVPDHATDDRRAPRSQDHRDDIEIVLCSSNDRRNNEHGLAGERKADAFEAG